jgi:sterol desaturase/sphingolipid hydroxylase (fatty acid hydroxylase superfamily)
MNELLNHTSKVYAFDYFGIILVLSLLECVVPQRIAGDTLRLRWLGNFALAIGNAVLLRAFFPFIGVAAGTISQQRGWGLFNQVPVPGWAAFIVTLLVLDFVAYSQHVVLHHMPWLWRIHRTHHTDHECDLTTGVRFHPFEAIVTTVITAAAVVALGAPPAFVFASTLLTTFIVFAEHANVKTPARLERVLRWLLVTPEMHRVHHSRERREGQSNFGAAFPWWDRLLGTYVAQPSAGHDRVAFGVAGFEDRKHLSLPWMLAQPFLSADTPRGAAASAGVEATATARRGSALVVDDAAPVTASRPT